MNFPCTGVILAGGMNTRFSGKDKALVRLGEKRIIDYIYDVFSELFDEIILVSNHPLQFLDLDVLIVKDLFALRSSLTGIHTGLFYASRPNAFFTACDTPFLKREVIETVLNKIDPDVEAIIPELSVGLEPLCAVYARKSLPRIERQLAKNSFKIQLAFKKSRIKTVSEKHFRKNDPELMSFFNINSPEDLDRANRLLENLKP